MIYGLYNSAAGMLTSEYRQNVLANNLANAETVGFKPEIAVFAERPPESVSGPRTGPSAGLLSGLSGGLWLGRTQTDLSVGPVIPTERSTDVALQGAGFLVVQKDGQTLYTRDGRMLMDAGGNLVAASDGAAMLGTNGTPIRLNPHGAQPTFEQDGRILQDGQIVGQLELVDFADHATLRHAGAARFDANGAQPIRSMAGVMAGYLEQSGVEPISMLTSGIEASRAYQLNAQMVSLQDQTIGRLISVISRV